MNGRNFFHEICGRARPFTPCPGVSKRKVSDRRIKEIIEDINDLLCPSLGVPQGTVLLLKRAKRLIKDLTK